MKFRKNRLVMLAALGILTKWVVDDKKKIEKNEEKDQIFKGFKDAYREKYGVNGNKKSDLTTYSTTYASFEDNTQGVFKDVFNNVIEVLSISNFDNLNGVNSNKEMEFIGLKVKFTNGSNEMMTVSNKDFTLEADSNSQRIMLDLCNFNETTLNIGESVEGTLVYEVLKSSNNLNLTFSTGGSLSRLKIRIK